MSSYENSNLGDIIIVKNIIFSNNSGNKKQFDHAWKLGRPCLLIYSDEEYDYFLTLSSKLRDQKFSDEHFFINESDLLYKSSNRKYRYETNYRRHKVINKNRVSRINLVDIYKIPISGHDVLDKINFETYKDIIFSLKQFHQKEELNDVVSGAKLIKSR